MSLIPLSRRAGGSLIVRTYLRGGLLRRLPKEEPTSVLQFMGGGSHRYHYRQYISPSKPLFVSGRKVDESTIASNKKYLSETLGFSKNQLVKLQASPSNILTLENGVLEERVNWLQQRLNLDDDELSKVIREQPSILGCSIPDNLEPTLDWLQQRLDLDSGALGKMIQTMPSILGCSIPDNLEPTLDWLPQRLDLDNAELGKMIQTMPSILNLSIPDNLEPKLDWLQRRFDLDNTALSKIIQVKPQILGYSIPDKMEPTLVWLQQRLSLTDAELIILIQKMPALLGLSVEANLQSRTNLELLHRGSWGRGRSFGSSYTSS